MKGIEMISKTGLIIFIVGLFIIGMEAGSPGFPYVPFFFAVFGATVFVLIDD